MIYQLQRSPPSAFCIVIHSVAFQWLCWFHSLGFCVQDFVPLLQFLREIAHSFILHQFPPTGWIQIPALDSKTLAASALIGVAITSMMILTFDNILFWSLWLLLDSPFQQ